MITSETQKFEGLPKTKALRAIVLDVDGVIADTLWQHIKAIQRTLRQFGYDGLAALDFGEKLKRHSSDKIFGELIENNNLVKRSEGQTDEDFIKECYQLKKRMYETKTDYYVQEIENDINSKIPECRLMGRPGIDELLLESNEACVPLAIASASNMEAVGKLVNRLGFDGFFRTKVCHAPHNKPDPHSYLSALQPCGVTKSEYHQCIAIEDTSNGALSALAAGMQVVITKSSFTEMDKITPLVEKGLTSADLRRFRAGRMPEDDIRELECMEQRAGPRKIVLVTDDLQSYLTKIAYRLQEHGQKEITLLDAFDDLIVGVSKFYKA